MCNNEILIRDEILTIIALYRQMAKSFCRYTRNLIMGWHLIIIFGKMASH